MYLEAKLAPKPKNPDTPAAAFVKKIAALTKKNEIPRTVGLNVAISSVFLSFVVTDSCTCTLLYVAP